MSMFSTACKIISMVVAHTLVASYAQSRQEHVEVKVEQGQRTQAIEGTYTLGTISATLVQGLPLRLRVKESGSEWIVQMPDDMVRITAVRRYQDKKLEIAGMVNGDVWKLAIVDLHTRRVSDQFLCYSPSISDDGRYVAFIKFFPSHGVSSAEDHYMLYDASLSSPQNRPLAWPAHPGIAGRIVYPKGLTNVPGDNVNIDDRPLHQIASQGFFWNEDSTAYFFCDQVEDRFTVVLVRPSSAGDIVSTLDLPSSELCPSASTKSCFEQLYEVTYPKDNETDVVQLAFRGYNGTPERPTTLKLRVGPSRLDLVQ